MSKKQGKLAPKKNTQDLAAKAAAANARVKKLEEALAKAKEEAEKARKEADETKKVDETKSVERPLS